MTNPALCRVHPGIDLAKMGWDGFGWLGGCVGRGGGGSGGKS